MPQVGFEPTTPLSERAMIVTALNLAANDCHLFGLRLIINLVKNSDYL
jgi:hypothetical protein